MYKAGDCTIVDSSINLEDLRQWKMNENESVPFYLHMGDSGGLMFNDNPETVRELVRVYNAQKLFFDIKLVSFLHAEGITASKVSAPLVEVLGYQAELCNN